MRLYPRISYRILTVFATGVIAFQTAVIVFISSPGDTRRYADLTSVHGSMVTNEIQSTVVNVSSAALVPAYDDKTCDCGLHFRVKAEQALVFPTPKQTSKKFLTIGIPTVKRIGNNSDYLITTVKSLLDNIRTEQRNDVILLIMAADTDASKRDWVLKELQNNFLGEIESGVIHVIKAPPEYYRDFKVTKLTYKTKRKKAEWRSKQNFDYAYQMKYSAPLSHYYMQLEDDVNASSDYVTKIKDFIKESDEHDWVCLEFSHLGFIGKLYRSEHTEKLAQVLLMFFQEHPGDYLYEYFNTLMYQMKKIIRMPTLFQHRGKVSSLPGKIQPLKDRLFNIHVREFHGDNPKADIFTTMTAYAGSDAENPYGPFGVFWTFGPPKPKDNYVVIFDSPQPVDRIFVATGLPDKTDRLLSASLAVSASWTGEPPAQCVNSTVVGYFEKGRADVRNITKTVNFDVKCFEITVILPQKSWVFLQEVDVFVSEKGGH